MSGDNDENKKDKSKKNNWKAFGMSVLTAFCTVLIIGFLGANFVYYTRINLDLFFPSDIDQRPYTDENKNGSKLPPVFPNVANNSPTNKQQGGRKMKGGSKSSGCGMPIDFSESPLLDNKYVRGTFDYGTPYQNRDNGFIPTWISNKTKHSYSQLRHFVKMIIDLVASTCAMVPESMKDIVPFILGPVVIGFIILITSFWWIPTLISIFWNENQNWGLVLSIVGLFFGWTWATVSILTTFQIIGILFSFILLPILLNPKKIIEIIGNAYNSYYLLLLLFILVTVAAFTHLNAAVAVPMLLVFMFGLKPQSSSSDANNGK
jgi:hypothetical protein